MASNIKNELTAFIPINRYKNKIHVTPTIFNNYIWQWNCSICDENAVGRIKCSEFSFAITSPTYKNKKDEIEKLALCEVCIDKYKLDNFQTSKTLVDDKGNKYTIKGLERGQYMEQMDVF
jgi:Tfp pilus assembly protein PilF